MPDNKGLTVDELIKVLEKYPKDAKVVVPYLYRLPDGALRSKEFDVTDATPCFELGTNKLVGITIDADVDIKEVGVRQTFWK